MTYEEKGYKIIDHTFDVSREGTQFQARGKIVMAVSGMKYKDAAPEELTIEKSGKEDEDGTGADHT